MDDWLTLTGLGGGGLRKRLPRAPGPGLWRGLRGSFLRVAGRPRSGELSGEPFFFRFGARLGESLRFFFFDDFRDALRFFFFDVSLFFDDRLFFFRSLGST